MGDRALGGRQKEQSKAVVPHRRAQPIVIQNSDYAVLPPLSFKQKSSYRLMKIGGIAGFAVLSAGLGYLWRDGDFRKAVDYRATLAFSPAISNVAATYDGATGEPRVPLTRHVLHLFERGQKGPRADKVAMAMEMGARREAGLSVVRRMKSSPLASLKEQAQPVETAALAGATVFLANLSAVPALPGGPAEDASADAPPKYPGAWSRLLQNAVLSPESPKGRTTLFGGLTEDEFRERELRCMANAIYFEARDEPVKGQIAVGQVIMNRVRSPYYPKTICGVVYQGERLRTGCQFSFTCTRKFQRVNEKEEWLQSVKIAKQVIAGEVWVKEVADATHYHATYVRPDWRHEFDKVALIGTHIFYQPKPGTVQMALLTDGG